MYSIDISAEEFKSLRKAINFYLDNEKGITSEEKNFLTDVLFWDCADDVSSLEHCYIGNAIIFRLVHIADELSSDMDKTLYSGHLSDLRNERLHLNDILFLNFSNLRPI